MGINHHQQQWERVDHGWRAVAALCGKEPRWTAYIEYAEVPQWRIWAGCLFPTLQEAQEWCQSEIVYQMKFPMVASPSIEPAWQAEAGQRARYVGV